MSAITSVVVIFLFLFSQVGFSDDLINSPLPKKKELVKVESKTPKTKKESRKEKQKALEKELQVEVATPSKIATSDLHKGPARIPKENLKSPVKSNQLFDGFKTLGMGPNSTWQIMPGFEFGTHYDSNINRERPGNRDEDIILSYIPSIDIRRSGSRYDFRTGYEMNFQEYLGESEQNGFNHLIANKFHYTRHRLHIKLSEGFSLIKTYASSEQVERRNIMMNDLNPEMIYQLSPKFSVSSIYQNYLFSYRQSAFEEFNYLMNSIGGRFYYHPTSKLDLYLQGAGFTTDYYNSGIFDSEGYTIMAGGVGQLTKKLRANVQTGFKGNRYDDQTLNSYNDWVLEGAFQYRFTPKMDVTLLAKRDKEESTYRNNGWFRSDYLGLILNHRISRRIAFSSENSIRENTYVRETTENGITKKRKDTILENNAVLKWNPMKNLVLSVAYTIRQRLSDFDNVFDYVVHALDSSISYQFA